MHAWHLRCDAGRRGDETSSNGGQGCGTAIGNIGRDESAACALIRNDHRTCQAPLLQLIFII